jgi:uncharacterized membrane protein YsdA (DUF1294 family)
MLLTFASVLFPVMFLFKGLQKNFIFILYLASMLGIAYFCENNLGCKITPFYKTSFLLFILFHLPLINLFTFFMYGIDKRRAKKGEWRISEAQIHSMELLGGTIGAYIGQRFFHHKSKKKSFLATFWAVALIQIIAVIYILKYLRIW